VWQQRLANGNVVMPFHLDGSVGNAQRANGTPHDWNDSQQAWDNGRMDQWPRYKNPISMGYFKDKRNPLPLRAGECLHAVRCLSLRDAHGHRCEPLVLPDRHQRRGTRPARPSSPTSGTPSTAWPAA
jgi:hypothetical protein